MWSSSHLSAHYIGAHPSLVELTQSWPLIGWTSEVCYELLSLDATEVSTTTVTAPQQQRWRNLFVLWWCCGPGSHSSLLISKDWTQPWLGPAAGLRAQPRYCNCTKNCYPWNESWAGLQTTGSPSELLRFQVQTCWCWKISHPQNIKCSIKLRISF